MLMGVPNLPQPACRVAPTSTATWCCALGSPRASISVRDHVDWAPLGLDFETGARSAGARFTFMRAASRGCTARWRSSCWTCTRASTATPSATRPTSSTREILRGTGQLPKFKADLFCRAAGGRRDRDADAAALYLIPTSEVTLTNTVRDARSADAELPIG